MNLRKNLPLFGLLILGIAALFALDLTVGSASITFADIFNTLQGKGDPTLTLILRDIRLPHAITAILVGAGLGMGGMVMQTLLRNPLAEPYILGISSGASMGVVLVSLGLGAQWADWIGVPQGSGSLSMVSGAFLGASLLMVIVILFSQRMDAVMLLIVGLMAGYFSYGIVSMLVFFRSPEELRTYHMWTLGSLAGVTWRNLPVMAVIITGGGLLLCLRYRVLDVLLMGEPFARTVGIHVTRERWLLLLTVSLVAATLTAFCGPIAFIGIAAPHISRLIFRSSTHAVLLPGSILTGVILSQVAAFVAKAPWSPNTLPFNAVAALIGAPVVVWLLINRSTLRSFSRS